MSGVLLAVLTFLPGVARATVCTLPSDCFSVGEVCNLGICTPCGSDFSDGGLNGGLLSCQDPATPICDIPDASLGGQCVQCTSSANCTGGDTCDQATQTCVPGDGGAGDAGAEDAGEEHDASSSDAGASDASTHDAGGGETDASSAGDAASSEDATAPSDAASGGDGATETTDGSSSEDAAGPLSDGATPGADASEDASSEDGGGSLGDGAYVEGGGCSCNAVGGSASMGGATLAFILALAGIRRRRSR